jgi:hypothetical protein
VLRSWFLVLGASFLVFAASFFSLNFLFLDPLHLHFLPFYFS